MAKRKSTDKPASNEAEDTADTPSVAKSGTSADRSQTDPDTVADAVDAVDAYAPANDTESSAASSSSDMTSDDAVEQSEPERNSGEDRAVKAESSPDQPTIDAAEDTIASAAPDKEDLADASDPKPTKTVSDDAAPDVTTDTASSDPDAKDDETAPLPVAPQVVRETVVERKGGFFPMLLGGAVAAALGYGVAAYVSQDLWPFATGAEADAFESEMREALSAQDGTLIDVSKRLTALEGAEPPTVDLSAVDSQLSEVQDGVSDLSARLDEIVARIDTLERQPMEQAVSPEAIAAYKRALADLQAEVEAQRAEVEQMAQEAVAAETNASEQAQLAAARAAMADVTAALETGAGFADALDTLADSGVDVPQALRDVADSGVATQVALIESFPEAARDALSVVRSAETETAEGTNRIATFFANQLGARSVAPRDGDDPDAVLSRSEAAVRAGDLDSALTELSALPDMAQTAMADWRSRAETRLAAKQAADTLVQQLLQK